MILSSAALRTQLTADGLAEKIGYVDHIEYMDELYLTRPEMVMNVLSLQDDSYESIFLVGHNPTLTELANILQDENFTKMPTLGILAIKLDIDSWEEINENAKGKIDFFIFPKQFKYYMPGQIRTTLE
jgi:phosphohistidine phosphatase